MEKKYSISDLNEIEVQHILNGLAELPAKISFNLIVKVDQQIKAQQKTIVVPDSISPEGELIESKHK